MDVLSLNDLDVLLRGVQQRMTAFLEETKAQPQLPGQFHSATIGFSLELDRVAAIIERLTFQPATQESEIAPPPKEPEEPLELTELEPISASKRRRMLLHAPSQHRRPESKFVVLRREAIETVRNFLNSSLLSLQDVVLHELFYPEGAPFFDDLEGTPKECLRTALNHPEEYLVSLKDASTLTDSAALPDTIIVYNLHRECGKLINLFDLLQAFASVIAQDSSSEDVQARFVQAISQLQYLGFLKPTKRKTDHMQRLAISALDD
eukprot:m.497420 g.497420  ORF g.497420 m.497420 type:complete len:264 (-) comp57312_c0_seq21:754-1545(-)